MGDIEFIANELFAVEASGVRTSSPLIDWGWQPEFRRPGRMRPWTWPAVAFPHVVTVVMGTVLFVLGLFGLFGPI
jgi:hypothetical protein